jgi:hypothetical protein
LDFTQPSTLCPSSGLGGDMPSSMASRISSLTGAQAAAPIKRRRGGTYFLRVGTHALVDITFCPFCCKDLLKLRLQISSA